MNGMTMNPLRVAILVASIFSMPFAAHAADSDPIQVLSESGSKVLGLASLYNDAQGKMLTNGNALNFGLMSCYQIGMLNLQVINSNLTLTASLMALSRNATTPPVQQQSLEALTQASASLKISAMSAFATVKTQSANPLCRDGEFQEINRQAEGILTGMVAAFDTLPTRP